MAETDLVDLPSNLTVLSNSEYGGSRLRAARANWRRASFLQQNSKQQEFKHHCHGTATLQEHLNARAFKNTHKILSRGRCYLAHVSFDLYMRPIEANIQISLLFQHLFDSLYDTEPWKLYFKDTQAIWKDIATHDIWTLISLLSLS